MNTDQIKAALAKGYTLSEGLIATLDGINPTDRTKHVLRFVLNGPVPFYCPVGGAFAPWYMLAERLRYREGEPWVEVDTDAVYIHGSSERPFAGAIERGVLGHLSAVVCDGDQAFRILHWCVHNLGI